MTKINGMQAPSFNYWLERIIDGDIKRLVVAHPDRLVRFGYELVKWLCEKFECELVVLNISKLHQISGDGFGVKC